MVAYVTPNGVCITAAEIGLLLHGEPRCPRSVHQCLMLKNKPWNWAVVSCVDHLWCIASFLLFCGSYLCHHELESGYLRLIGSQKWMWMWQTEVKLEFWSYFWLILKKKNRKPEQELRPWGGCFSGWAASWQRLVWLWFLRQPSIKWWGGGKITFLP